MVRNQNSMASPLECFITGGLFTVLGLYIAPSNWQAGFVLLGFGMVFLMSVSSKRRKEFTDFFWELFKGIVHEVLGRLV